MKHLVQFFFGLFFMFSSAVAGAEQLLSCESGVDGGTRVSLRVVGRTFLAALHLEMDYPNAISVQGTAIEKDRMTIELIGKNLKGHGVLRLTGDGRSATLDGNLPGAGRNFSCSIKEAFVSSGTGDLAMATDGYRAAEIDAIDHANRTCAPENAELVSGWEYGGVRKNHDSFLVDAKALFNCDGVPR